MGIYANGEQSRTIHVQHKPGFPAWARLPTKKVSWTFKNKKRVRLVSLTTGTVENGERVLDLCLLMVFSFSLCLSYFGEGCGVDPIPEGLYDWRALDGWISFV